jgi:hypothetical protein
MNINPRVKKLFAIDEIAESRVLQVLSAAFLFSFLITFSGWTSDNFTFGELSKACMPHLIEACSEYKQILPLTPLPFGYSQTIFYVLLFSLICLGFYYLYHKKYELVWLAIFILWLYKFYIIFGFGSGNYDYYDLILITIFLFLKDKLYWLRFFFISLYFLSSTIKIHEGWILGTYFTSLETGLPLVGNYLAPIATNIVIISQMFFAWLLLKPKNTLLFRLSFGFFLFFHLYSGILVEYRYLITSIPLLVILFLLPETRSQRIHSRYLPQILLITLLFLQSVAILIPGDQKLSLEGNKYGLYMFEANHQCIANYTIYFKNGLTATDSRQSSDARNRCDPYDYIYNYKRRCDDAIEKISATFDHSINGNPFYRIVDVSNICLLEYKPFRHNHWIKLESDQPKLVGYPAKNFYSINISRAGEIQYTANEKMILPGLEKNSFPGLNSLQEWLYQNLSFIEKCYWFIWVLELVGISYFVFIKKNKKSPSL